MKFNIIDTEAVYRRLLAAESAAAREAIFRDELVAPFAGLVQVFGGGDAFAMFKQWGMSPEQFADDGRARVLAGLEQFAAHDAWNRAAQALEDGRRAFAPYLDRIPTEIIHFALVLNAPSQFVPAALDHGYSGFGAIPGYIMVTYSSPTPANLRHLQGATVHELHHNILSAAMPGSPMIASLGNYIVGEGLAESFAAELYGEEVIGFYVTEFDSARMEESRQIIGSALDESGFNEVRGYIFGDAIAGQMGLPQAGVPAYAGYAIGYHVVQAYLKRTGRSVVEATFVPAREIIAESGFFD